MTDNETGLGFAAPHPGEILKHDVLPQLDMSIGEFARHLGIRRAGLSELMNGHKRVTQNMVIRLGKALQTGARYWLAMQVQYDLSHEIPKKAADINVSPLFKLGGDAA